MTYYITEKNSELKIIKVHPRDEASFLADHSQHVLAKGNSLAEALLQFEKLNYHQQKSG